MDWQARLGKRIKLRDLHILEAVVRAGSMMKAARDLGITQPAVSYAIAEMEHALGVPLLDRTSHGVLPTIYGEVLLQRSAAVFNELRLGLGEIASLADPSTGELRVGTTPPMSAIASAAFNELVAAYPGVRFYLEVGPTDVLLRQLRRRDIELIITRTVQWSDADDLSIKTLFHDELAVICSKHNKWSQRRKVRLADLVEEPWVFPPPSGFLTQIIRSAFDEAGVAMPAPRVVTSSTYALTVLVANGSFLAMHPDTMLTTPNDHPQLRAVDVRLRKTRGLIGLITLKDRALSPTGQLFIRFAVQVTKAIPAAVSRAR